ncbi:OmpA family protein [candidate division WOR-3 bacterium]|nr:OmpA family protein [candidate division WOR-3 bacterium]
MKRTTLLGISAGLALICTLSAADVGSNAFALLRSGYGASAPAVGGTGTIWTTDASGMWWNPAGLEGISKGEVMLGYRAWFASMHDEFASFAWPWRRSTLGVAAFYSVTAVQAWSEDNEPTGKLYPQSGVLDIAWAYSLKRGLSLGLGSKILYENLIELSGIGAAFDVGIMWRFLEWMSVGAALHDLGPGVFYQDSRVSVPWAADAGLSLSLIPMTTISITSGYVSDAGIEGNLGVEVSPHELISIRVGSRINSNISEWRFWSVPTAGLGLNWKGFRLDYAVVPYGPLGTTHSLCISRYLKERRPSADVLVKVVDSRDSAVLVSNLEMSGAIVDTTEVKGQYRRDWVNPEDLTVKAEAARHYQAEKTTTLEPGRLNVIVVALDSIPYALLAGAIMDQDSKTPASATIFFKGEVADSIRSDPTWGTFKSNPLPPGEYMVRVVPDDEKLQASLTRINLPPGQTVMQDLYVYREKKPNVLMTLYLSFETGKADILLAHAPILDSIAPVLRENADRGLTIEIAGHTDNVPVVYSPFGDNQHLSEARAEAIRTYLVEKHNLPEKMFVCKGYGEFEPLTSNETAEGRAMNRRIEFRMITKEE